MSKQQIHIAHAGSCQGHCRAQRFALNQACCAASLPTNYYCSEQYEKEKAAIKAYEDGWDDFDGPIWPWRQTNNAEAEIKFEEEWQPCCNGPSEEAITELHPVRKEELSTPMGSGSSTVSSLLWGSDTQSCPKCGRKGPSSHL